MTETKEKKYLLWYENAERRVKKQHVQQLKFRLRATELLGISSLRLSSWFRISPTIYSFVSSSFSSRVQLLKLSAKSTRQIRACKWSALKVPLIVPRRRSLKYSTSFRFFFFFSLTNLFRTQYKNNNNINGNTNFSLPICWLDIERAIKLYTSVFRPAVYFPTLYIILWDKYRQLRNRVFVSFRQLHRANKEEWNRGYVESGNEKYARTKIDKERKSSGPTYLPISKFD